jgi:MscS family membrane protein
MAFIEYMTQIFGSNLYFGNTLGRYLLFFGTIGLAVLIGKALYWVFENIIRKFTEKTKTKIDDIIFDAIRKPMILVLVILGIYLGSLLLTLSESMQRFFSNTVEFLIILNVGWFIIGFLDSIIEHYLVPFAQQTETDLDDHLIPVLRTVLKVVIFCVTIIVALSNIGFNVGAFLAGLGIGGLALALASKDILANLFGGITILTDRPFKMGDLIDYKGRRGTILEIGMRTTKIRTIENTVMIIPNSNITVDMIENVTAGTERRFKFTIGIEYGSSAKDVEKAVEIVKDCVNKMPHVNTEKTLVAFESFNAYSLDITCIYFMKEMTDFFTNRGTMNLELKKRFEKAKISMAFPTQTIEIKKA